MPICSRCKQEFTGSYCPRCTKTYGGSQDLRKDRRELQETEGGTGER